MGEIPYGIHVDEAGMAYDAYSLKNFGVDRYLAINPVYFINFGGGQNALYTYLTSIVLHFLPFSSFSIRLPAVILSLLSIFVFSYFLKKEKGELSSLISLFLFCVLPFSIMHSRWGLESYLFFPMLLLSICFYLWAFQKKKIFYFIFSGILFGLTLYTYAISYLIIPLFLGITLVYGLWKKKVKWTHVIALSIPLFFLALPLMLMLAVNKHIISEIRLPFLSIQEMWWYRGGEFSLKNIFHNLNIFSILFWKDGLIYNSFPTYGTLYGVSIVFFVYGMYLVLKKCFQKSSTLTEQFFLVLFIVIFLVVMTLDGPNINRANAIYVPIIYFIVVGINSFIHKNKFFGMMVCIIYSILFSSFISYYFQEYPKEYTNNFFFVSHEELKEALSFAKEKTEGVIYVIDESYNQPYIYTILMEQMSPYEFHKTSEIKGDAVTKVGRYEFILPENLNSITAIFLKPHLVPEEMKEGSYEVRDFGGIVVYSPSL